MFGPDPILVQRKLNRTRVAEFEKEIETSLNSLDVIEKSMKDVGQQRKDWLENIAHSHQRGTDIYQKRLELIKVQGEMASLNLKLDILRLERQYETQTLSSLVEATKPLGERETEQEREVTLMAMARKDNDLLRDALQASLDYRLQLGNYIYDLSSRLSKIKAQAEAEHSTYADDLKTNLQQYMTKMNISMEKSRSLYKTIVKEYLILRHNAHVAKEVLLRSQHDATAARTELQKCLDGIVQEAAEQRERLETASHQELAVRVGDLRDEVIRKERQLEELIIEVRNLKSQRVGDYKELRRMIRKYEARYNKLQKHRSKVVPDLNEELDQLRHNVVDLEIALAESPNVPKWNPEPNAQMTEEIRKKLNDITKKMQNIGV